jgi:uncharacterized low-complexity protein
MLVKEKEGRCGAVHVFTREKEGRCGAVHVFTRKIKNLSDLQKIIVMC